MKLFVALMLLAWPLLGAVVVTQKVVDHAKADPSGQTAVSFEAHAYAGDLRNLPIGVFDSGIGGLTVLEAILRLDAFHNDSLQPGADGVPDFAQERFIYFGDQANMPYGNYSSVGKTDYLRELILKDAVFLLGKRWFDPAKKVFRTDKPPVKAIVIACNTATAYGLADIREAVKAWGLPVIVVGVVEAGARGVKETQASEGAGIGVLATVGTCASGAYPRLIGSALGLAGRTVPSITQQGSPSLAGVIEGDPSFPQSVTEQARVDVRQLVETHRASGSQRPLGTVVLGCTHFPLAQVEIDAAFAELRSQEVFRGLIADKIQYVDPAEWTARELFRELASARLRLKPGEQSLLAENRFFLSIANLDCPTAQFSTDGALDKSYKYGRQPGMLTLEDTINVPLTQARLPSVSRKLVEEKLPRVWQSLKQEGSDAP